jgi:3-oxoacyl-[acyl-carrier protein] reductase
MVTDGLAVAPPRAAPLGELESPRPVPRNLVGQHAIITGGAQGIGLAVARRLHAAGAAVALLDLDGDRARAEAEAMALDGAPAIGLTGDVADAAQVEAAAAQTLDRFGSVEVLVNNAGIVGRKAPCWEQTDANWQRVLAVNLTGTFNCCRELSRHMRDRGYGRIVNVASISARDGNASCAPYSASKAGILGLTRALALELAGSGVLVNAVAPALIATARNGSRPAHETEPLIARIPLGRAGLPAEVAALVHYLASEDCSFSTGAVFDCTGGRAGL